MLERLDLGNTKKIYFYFQLDVTGKILFSLFDEKMITTNKQDF